MNRVSTASTYPCRAATQAMGVGVFALASMLGVSPALAQAQASDKTFEGFRLEAITGYDNEGIDFDDDFYNGGKNGQSGWMYGVGVGYDYQTGPVVLGVEAEYSDSTASRSENVSGVRPANPIAGVPVPVATSLETKAGADLYFGGRIGYVVDPEILIYAKVGYTHERVEIDGDGTDGGVPFDFDEKVKLHGFRLGAGGEYRFGEGWYAKAEYRYTNYNNGKLSVQGSSVDLNPLFDGIDVVRHQVVIGAGYRF